MGLIAAIFAPAVLTLLAGTGSLSIPVIIHLLNRRRFRQVIWAAMEFLLAAHRRNARRLQFQRWLLLILRCLALMVLAAALAMALDGRSLLDAARTLFALLFVPIAPIVLPVLWGVMELLHATVAKGNRPMRIATDVTRVLGGTALALWIVCGGLFVSGWAVDRCFGEGKANGFLGGQRVYVVVWDDSYSQSYANPGRPANFDKSKKLLTEWLNKLEPADAVAVVRASQGAEPMVATPTLDRAAVKRAVEEVTVSDAGTDLAGALTKAGEIVELNKQAKARTVVVLTDLSMSSLGRDVDHAGGTQQLKQACERIKRSAGLKVVDAGEMDQQNKGLVGLRLMRPVVVVGRPVELEVTVRNGTPQPQLDIPLTIAVDSVVVDSRKFGKVDPGGDVSTRTSVTINTPGRHLIEARIGEDLVPVDDVRRLIVNVVQEVPLLLVDGAPADKGHLGATTFLEVAWSPTIEGKLQSMFASEVIPERSLGQTKLLKSSGELRYAAVVLSNTDLAKDDTTTLGEIKKYVDAGGLLMVFPGDRTAADRLNGSLGGGGAGLLPASVGQLEKIATAAEAAEGIGFDPLGYAHPVLELFRNAAEGGQQVGLTTAQTSQYFSLNVPADPSIETVLRFSPRGGAKEGAPAVVSKRVGKGRVVLFATSGDTSWTSFPAKPAFVPFMWELLLYSLSSDASSLTLPLGTRILLPTDAAPADNWKGPRGEAVRMTTSTQKDGRGVLESAEPLRRAGVYGPAGAPPIIAVNPDPDEVDIRHVSPAQMAAAMGVNLTDILPGDKPIDTRDRAADAAGNPIASLGRLLVLVALALFALESLLARLFSVYR